MPLGFLAKDSIQDLEALGRDAAKEEQKNGKKPFTEESDPEIGTGLSLETDEESETTFHSMDQDLQQELSTAQVKAEIHVTPPPSSESVASESPGNGAYAGFSSAYHEAHLYSGADYYDMPSYPASIPEKRPANGFWQSLLPCIFPWTSHEASPERPVLETKDSLNMDDTAKNDTVANKKRFARSPSSGEGDDVSTGSDALGEKLSNKERQAVLARLGLAQPEAGEETVAPEEGPPAPKKGLLNDLQQYDTSPLNQPPPESPPKRGILKRRSVSIPKSKNLELPPSNRNIRNVGRIQPQRRSLFPQVKYEYASNDKSKMKTVSFAPMARVVTVKSKNDMNSFEKGSIWWQKADYEDFRKTGRIITKAMLEGGSEVWLSSERSRANGSGKQMEDGAGDSITATGDKWWHKFGHSRRGLEHVVSMEEGRQRQLNVRTAIHAVLDEQTRQRMYNRPDKEKLRMVSLQYTSWARDLALASGSSDADAVRSSFSNERKTREFFLLKMARGSVAVASSGKHVPEFMQPALHGAHLSKQPAPYRLDANTSAQLRYRRKNRSQQSVTGIQPGQPPPSTTTESKRASSTEKEVCEPVVDREGAKGSMARKAAGFSSEGAQKVDMAAVLSGMGAVPQSSQVMSTA